MNKKITLALSAIFIGAATFAAFSTNSLKDDRLYTVQEAIPPKDLAKIDSEIRSKSSKSFCDISGFTEKLKEDAILVTVSSDKDSLFYMTPSMVKGKAKGLILKGRTSIDTTLYKKQLSTGKITEVAANIPFITSAAWSPDGSFVVFKSEDFVLLYSIKDETSLMEKELAKEKIEAVSWCEDGKKLYLEYSSIPNGGVIYMDSLKLAQSYEIREEVFPKDSLDDGSYFAVDQNINTSAALLSTCSTLVMDHRGKELVNLAPGIFKDSFQQSVLLKNLNNTYSYIKDFSSNNIPVKLTEKVVYAGGFLYDGGLYYITETENSLTNSFTLHRLDNSGKELADFEISGSSILLLQDGKTAYVNGPGLETINFEANTISSKTTAQSEKDDLLLTLAAGIKDVKSSITGSSSIKSSPYFAPSAAASVDYLLSNVKTGISEGFKDLYTTLNPEELIVLKSLNLFGNNKAEAEIQVTARTYWIKAFNEVYKLQLVKNNGQWKINELR